MNARDFAEQKRQTLKLVEAAARNKISLIQIREKNLSARLVYEFAREAAFITRESDTKLLINDRADIALAANADGVHLTSDSLSAEIVRREFPKDFIVGVSTHTIEEAENARKQQADFVAFSPIFSTPGKGKPQGIGNLRRVCEKLKPFPVIALGGINADNFSDVLEAGASGFAAIRFLNEVENLKNLTFNKRR